MSKDDNFLVVRGPIFSDLLRLGARASLLARTASLSSNAVPVRAGSGAAGVAAAATIASGASMAAGTRAAGVPKEPASSNKVLKAAAMDPSMPPPPP